MQIRLGTRITPAGRTVWRAAGVGWLFITCGVAASVLDETPIGPKWWPSRYGPDDRRGAANLQTPEKVL